MENFVIGEFVSALIAHDRKGRKAEFLDRRSACFIITVRGKIRFTSKYGAVVSDKDHVVFLPKGLTYVNECIESAESYVFNFHTIHSYEEPLSLPCALGDIIHQYYESIISKSFSPSLQNTLMIFEMLYSLSRHVFYADPADIYQHPIIKKAMDFMHRNCGSSELTVGDVAQYCCISEIYLRKIFEREIDSTPYRQLMSIRMKKAELLISEKRPLKEIAVSVGYSDVFQFSRAYKRYFGYPPSRSQV